MRAWKPVAGVLGLAFITGMPVPAQAQQLYECTWTITTMTIRTTYNDGSVSYKIIQDRTEVCRPI